MTLPRPVRRITQLAFVALALFLASGTITGARIVASTAADADFDNVPDSIDACPFVAAATPDGCPVEAPMNGNFDGAGLADLVFVHRDTSQAFAWLMNGTSFFSGGWLYNSVEPGWKVVGTSDFTGEGMPDLLWQNEQTGQVRLFKMTYFSKVAEQLDLNFTVSGILDPNWRIEATGDFNRDGHADIIWHNHDSNSNQCCASAMVWYMGVTGGVATRLSASRITFGDLPTVPLPLHVVGTIDFDDSNPTFGVRDLVLQNFDTGDIYVYSVARMGDQIFVTAVPKIARVDPAWRIRAIGNYAGDSREDLIFQHQTTGEMYVWARSGAGFAPYGYLSPSAVNPAWELTGPR